MLPLLLLEVPLLVGATVVGADDGGGGESNTEGGRGGAGARGRGSVGGRVEARMLLLRMGDD